jgi:hypothetical protein
LPKCQILPKINKLNKRQNEKNYFILIIFLSVVGHSQVTSSAMLNGNGEFFATVEVVHKPNYYSTHRQVVMRSRARPAVKVMFIKQPKLQKLMLSLGSNLTVNVVKEESNALKEVVIVSTKSNGAFNKENRCVATIF